MAKSVSRIEKASSIEPQRAGARIETVDAVESVPSFYANNTRVETSLWDVKLRFAETVETDPAQNIIKVRELTQVRMSVQHARVLVDLMTKQLENYERMFGKIPHPKETAPE